MVELCLEAVGEDDYVLVMLDDLIKRSATFVALDGSKVIGMATYRDQLDKTGWVSSVRTHPVYRRKGVAGAIDAAMEKHGKQRGSTALRLWTEGDNEAGKAAFSKMGYSEIGRFTRLTAPKGESGEGLEVKRHSYSDDLWRRVNESEIMAESKSFVNYDFGFLKLEPQVLQRLADDGFIYGWGETVALLDMWYYMGVQTLEGKILTGDLRQGLMDLRAIAKDRSIPQVHTFPPLTAGLMELARKTGYGFIDWGNVAILCERPIR